ncbi:GtrA family protein [Oscillibacter sp. GMB15532]|uniref:GtrA family protein n=1 Tax=Oscillibacter sp. GMB15532 TaxID=3230022 RepID=UPI0034DE7EF3
MKKYEELLRYVFWGVMTVLVNTALYLGFSSVMGDLSANTLAFFLAVQFAYMSNTKFVFRDKFTKKNFLQFWGMRIGTIFIDNGGMWLLLSMDCNRLLAKCLINAIVIVLNYIFSKFFIYNNRNSREEK